MGESEPYRSEWLKTFIAEKIGDNTAAFEKAKRRTEFQEGVRELKRSLTPEDVAVQRDGYRAPIYFEKEDWHDGLHAIMQLQEEKPGRVPWRKEDGGATLMVTKRTEDFLTELGVAFIQGISPRKHQVSGVRVLVNPVKVAR